MALKRLYNKGMENDHGGNLNRARELFPDAPEPWIDLSTGVNPHAYPYNPISPAALTRLPDPARLAGLLRSASHAYGVSDEAAIVAAPGTQPLLPLLLSLIEPGRVTIFGPTYSEHARSADLAGHRIDIVGDLAELRRADLAIVVNPNNPDGRLIGRRDLLMLAEDLARHDGLLLIDEAFMDVAPDGYSLAGDAGRDNIVVLRSFGKFFGLAGLRLSFAILPPAPAAHLSAMLGPWPLSGAAIEIGKAALDDAGWRVAMRTRLAEDMVRLDDMLSSNGMKTIGGTSLFRLVEVARSAALHGHFGGRGILVRRFDERPGTLRLGLPGDESAWQRLATALCEWTS